MPPTRSIYTKTIERNGKEVETEKGFKGEDYLEHWAQSNVEEALLYEKREKNRLKRRSQIQEEDRHREEQKKKRLEREKQMRARIAREQSTQNLDNESQG